ncbi:glycosyltransferase [Paenibacillus amylolyticus]|uniref:glycosyltransferase n=1 Tax=Paenibacillus amylolyticus TaxID=1451 RepID=UPI0032422390
MTRKAVIEINFNNYGFDPQRLTREWLERRMDIFRRYTLNCLKAQTNQDFLTVVKLSKESGELMQEILAEQEQFRANIRFGTHIESVRAILSFAEGHEDIYIARLDSDDLYHRTFVQQLYSVQPKPETIALINQNGYLWDSVNNEMAPTFYRSPQFYVYLYKTEQYASGYRIKLPGRGTHGNVIDLPHELLAPRNYINVVHSSNTSVKKVPLKDRLNGSEIEQVLREFMV